MSATKLAILQAQLVQRQAYVTYFDARIRSGVYKKRVVHKGINGPLMPHDELLDDELATMLRHIRFMEELADEMGKLQEQENASSRNR